MFISCAASIFGLLFISALQQALANICGRYTQAKKWEFLVGVIEGNLCVFKVPWKFKEITDGFYEVCI